jgi:hypothetical protein
VTKYVFFLVAIGARMSPVIAVASAFALSVTPAQAGGKKHHRRGWNKLENIFLSQSVRAQTNQNPRGIVLLFTPSLLDSNLRLSWRSFKEPVKVVAKNGLTPFLFRPIQYISTLTGRFELPRGNWSGNAILAQIAKVCDLIQS